VVNFLVEELASLVEVTSLMEELASSVEVLSLEEVVVDCVGFAFSWLKISLTFFSYSFRISFICFSKSARAFVNRASYSFYRLAFYFSC